MGDLEENVEDIYYKYTNGELDEKYEMLRKKYNSKTITHSEYKEYSKLNSIKENINIIRNLIQQKQKLIQEIDEIKKEIEIKQRYRHLQTESHKINLKIQALNENNKRFESLINDDDYKEEREDIRQALNENLEEIEKKKQEYLKFKEQIQEVEASIKEFDNPIEMIEDKKIKIRKMKEKINYYNQIIRNLLNGKSWDEALSNLLKWSNERYKPDKDDDEIISDNKKESQIINEIKEVGLNGIKKSIEPDGER